MLPLMEEPAKVLEIATKPGEIVICSAVHTSGKWLAYCTTARVRLLKVNDLDSERPSVTRLPLPDLDIVHHMSLYTIGAEARLLVCPREGGAVVYSLEDDDPCRIFSASSSELDLKEGIARISVGSGSCVMTDFSDQAICFDLRSNTLFSKLPHYSEAAISAISTSSDGSVCILAYSNNRIMEVDLKKARYTQFSKDLNSRIPRGWLNRRTSILNVVHIAGNDDIVLLHDHSILATLDKEKEMPEPASKLMYTDPRSTPETDSASISSMGSLQGSRLEQTLSTGLRMSRKYEHLLSLHHLGNDEIVAVEIKPGMIESQLPPSLKQKKFGGC